MKLIDIIKFNENIFLYADGGAGKSYQLLFAYNELLKMGKVQKIIPMYIPLNNYGGRERNYVKDYIIGNYVGKLELDSKIENNYNALKDMFESGDYIYYILLDGINETSVFPSLLCGELRAMSCWKNLNIIITGRVDTAQFNSFKKLKLKKIDEAYCAEKIENYSDLNTRFQELLQRPFFFVRFLKIENNDKNTITSSVELMDIYYLDELIKRTEETAHNISYKEFCERVINEFIPEFAYKQLSKASYMTFDEITIINQWNSFVQMHIIEDDTFNSISHCIKVLRDLGVITKLPDKNYSFSHEINYTYFVSKYVYENINYNQKAGDVFLKDITDKNILLMTGEFLGEHKYANKQSLREEKSPVEMRLDAYRNVFDGSTSHIVSKYIEIMRLCRNNKCTADFSMLDLKNVFLYGFQWFASDFRRCILSPNAFSSAICYGSIIFSYYDENNKVIIASDLKFGIIVMDDYFSIITVIYTLLRNTTIKIYENCISICNTKNEEKVFNLQSKTYEQKKDTKCLITIRPLDDEIQICNEIINSRNSFLCDIYDNDYELWEHSAYQKRDSFLKLFNNGIKLALGRWDQEFEGAAVNVEKLGCVRFSNALTSYHDLECEDGNILFVKDYFEYKNLFLLNDNCYDASTHHLLYNNSDADSTGMFESFPADALERNELLDAMLHLLNQRNRCTYNLKLLYESNTYRRMWMEYERIGVYVDDGNYSCIYSVDTICILSLYDYREKIISLDNKGIIIYGGVCMTEDNVIFLSLENKKIFINIYNVADDIYVERHKQLFDGNDFINQSIIKELWDYSYNITFDGVEWQRTFVRLNENILIFFSKSEDVLYLYNWTDEKKHRVILKNENIIGTNNILLFNNFFIIYYGKHISKYMIEPETLTIRKEWTILDLDKTDIRKCDFSGAEIMQRNGKKSFIPKEIIFNT